MDMKKFLLLMLVIFAGIVSSCKYNDDDLWSSVDDLANRVSAVETLTQQMNSDIASMQAVITAVENQVSVSEVEKMTDGYILHFSNGTTATIKNGQDGTDGEDGEDGQDGQDAPAVGIAQEDGVYYWTLTVDGNTEWLTDDAGNKLAVSASAGSEGEDGEAGQPGKPGADGKPGVTPQLKVDNEGYWMVSYGGTNFDYIKDDAGSKISALGTKGEDGKKKFATVVPDVEKVTITMIDGATFVIPRLKGIGFYDADGNEVDTKKIEWYNHTNMELSFKLQLSNAKYTVLTETDDLDTDVDMANSKVNFTFKGKSVTDQKAVVLFFDETKTLTVVFKFQVKPWNGQVLSVTPINENGQVVYGITVAEELAWVAQEVNKGDAFNNKEIRLYNDLNLNGVQYAWKPIGSSSTTPFSGIFNGNGKSIKGLNVASIKSKALSRSTEITGAGLFGVVKNAALKNVTIADATVKADANTTGAGALVGCTLGSIEIEGVTVVKEEPKTGTEENKSSDVQGSNSVGSLVGYLSCDAEVSIKDCEVKDTSASSTASDETAQTESTSVGGLVGTAHFTDANATITIENCNVGGVELTTSTNEKETEGKSSSVGGVIGSVTVTEGVQIKAANLSVSDVSSNVSIVIPEDSDIEKVDYNEVVGNIDNLDADVKETIKEGTTSEIQHVDAYLPIKNVELSAALRGILGADSVLIDPATQYGKMKMHTIETLTELNFSHQGYTITTLDEIAKFKNLERLDCRSTKLVVCDLSQNSELTYVNVQSNALTALDFSQNAKLRQLICSYNPDLTSLNLANCTQLNSLQTQSTGLTALEIPNKEIMKNFLYGDTGLKDIIDLNEYPNVTSLGIDGLGYTSIDEVIPDNLKEKIHTLYCERNNFETFDFSKFLNLQNLYCTGNKISKLDVQNLKALSSLQCGNQQNGIVLELKMAESQREQWTSNWSKRGNENVKPIFAGSIEDIAMNGGTFTVNENCRLTTPLVVEKDMTIQLADGWLGATSGNEFADPDKLKTLIAVKPGVTLTIEGGNQLNTGHVLDQLSCIRLLGGSAAASKVVINNGFIIGTYYAIVVDEDCQNGEVEINGGSLSCDWNKEFNGTAILNKGNASITINGGSVSSCGSAVEMWNGSFNMTGGTLESTYAGEKSHVDTNGVAGNSIVGAALALYPGAGQNVKVTISKGTLKGLSSIYEITSTTGISDIAVIDGKFEGAINSYNCTRFISGGQFKVEPDAKFIVKGKAAVLDGGYYVIQDKEDDGEKEGNTSLPSWGKEELGNN